MTPRAHMLLHRNWERSTSNKPREKCIHGHLIDGVSIVNGKPRRFCRECGRQDCKRRRDRQRAVRRLAPMLPQSPAFAQALSVDDTPVEALSDVLPPAEVDADS